MIRLRAGCPVRRPTHPCLRLWRHPPTV
jgi:hypothetical protein